MRRVVALVALNVIVCIAALGCGGPAPTVAPTLTPAATPSLLQLPEGLSGIPGNEEFTVEVGPVSPSDELEIGLTRDLPLGHCGLVSPVDVDGSMWDPVGGHNGAGGPLTEDQRGELINSTLVAVVLTDPNTMEMRTPRGAVITLTRHDGPRSYFLCD